MSCVYNIQKIDLSIDYSDADILGEEFEEFVKGEAHKMVIKVTKVRDKGSEVWGTLYLYDAEGNILFARKIKGEEGRLRVNGVVMNCDFWYDLFGVDRNCKLFLPEERRAYIW